MTPTSVAVERGDVWEVRFDPSEGDEINKVRPAVVMDVEIAGRMQLHIVVPLTGWQPHFARCWRTLKSGCKLRKAGETGLRAGLFVVPIEDTRQVHGRCGEDELQVGFVQSPVARTAPVQRKHAL